MSTKRPYTPPIMEIDIFDENSFIATRASWNDSDAPWDPPIIEGPEAFVDAPVQNETAIDQPFVEEPFIEEPAAPEIDLGVPQIGVPVFTLDPVVGTDPVSDIMGGEDAPQ